MKQGIHPEYVTATVHCSCGNTFTTRSTKPELRVEICSQGHPFYTGKQNLVDTGVRVERFGRKAARRTLPKTYPPLVASNPPIGGPPALEGGVMREAGPGSVA